MSRPAASDFPATALVVGAGVAVLHVVFGPDILATLGTLYDDIVYVTLGKALAEGAGYRSIHLVGAPVHVKFPPLLPLSYAVLWWGTGSLKGVVYGAYALSMLVLAGGVAALWRYGSRVGVRWWLLAFFAVGPLLLLRTVRYFAGAVSEPWFLLGWATTLLLVDRLGDSDDSPSDRSALVLGLVLATTAMARTQAVVLIPAVLLALVVRRLPWRVAGVTAAAAFAPLAVWRVVHGRMMAAGPLSPTLDQAPYTDWMFGESFSETLGFLGVAVSANPPNYLQHAATILVGWSSWKAQALVLIAAGLALLGMFWSVRRRPELTLTVLAVVTVLAIWPFNQARFLTTLFPFAGLAAAIAANRLYGFLPGPVRRASVVGCALLTVALGVVNAGIRRNTYDYQTSAGSPPVAFAAAAAWIESHTEPGDHVLADYSAVYFLRTGRQTSIGFPEQPFTVPSVLIPPGRYLAQQLLADSVDYVVDARPSERRIGVQVAALTARCPGVLEPLPPVAEDEISPRYYRVTRDEACLGALAEEVSPASERLEPVRPIA